MLLNIYSCTRLLTGLNVLDTQSYSRYLHICFYFRTKLPRQRINVKIEYKTFYSHSALLSKENYSTYHQPKITLTKSRASSNCNSKY